MKIAVMPGSFDPFTKGHEDILKRACELFDFVYVGVLINKNKHCAFSESERVSQINKVIYANNIKNAAAESFCGLLAEFAKEKGACATVRGIRTINDFSAELSMFELNSKLCEQLETVCLFAKTQFLCVSSSAVREIAAFSGDIKDFVPDVIYKEVMERLCKR